MNFMDFRSFVESLTDEEINEMNKKEMDSEKEMFTEFVKDHDNGVCNMCNQKLTVIDRDSPCFHWFLYPNGIKKSDFKKYLAQPMNNFQLEGYLRWLATMEAPLKNINDMVLESTGTKIKEITIKYKNLEWTINYGKTDYDGHEGSQNAEFPHFHVQMLIDNRPFMRFNDYHIPFSEEALKQIEFLKNNEDIVGMYSGVAPGMNVLENPERLKIINDEMIALEDEKGAAFHTSTLFKMPEGEKATVGEILKIFEDAKIKGQSKRHALKDVFPGSTMITEIGPGEGVPEMKSRNKRNKK
ncbi:MAG: hypothetical protein OCD01_05620 [Fibrobacterales bacterium]